MWGAWCLEPWARFSPGHLRNSFGFDRLCSPIRKRVSVWVSLKARPEIGSVSLVPTGRVRCLTGSRSSWFRTGLCFPVWVCVCVATSTVPSTLHGQFICVAAVSYLMKSLALLPWGLLIKLDLATTCCQCLGVSVAINRITAESFYFRIINNFLIKLSLPTLSDSQ